MWYEVRSFRSPGESSVMRERTAYKTCKESAACAAWSKTATAYCTAERRCVILNLIFDLIPLFLFHYKKTTWLTCNRQEELEWHVECSTWMQFRWMTWCGKPHRSKSEVRLDFEDYRYLCVLCIFQASMLQIIYDTFSTYFFRMSRNHANFTITICWLLVGA